MATAEELAEDPTPVRYLSAAERPRYRVYEDVSVAFGSQCFSLKGNALQAVTVVNFAPQPVVERPKTNLDDVKTSPPPVSGSDDHDPDHD